MCIIESNLYLVSGGLVKSTVARISLYFSNLNKILLKTKYINKTRGVVTHEPALIGWETGRAKAEKC